ncbi:MAG TPA: HAD family phosphatase [Kiritimatiellia bacterium]|nr:HAD family phosphatase [Kiritimatiellia bacterium]
MTLSAVIFDLDGTLVDTELLWADALRDYLADQGCVCSKSQILDIVFGRSWTDIYRAIIALQPALAKVSAAGMAVDLRAYYMRLRDQSDSIVIESSVRLLKKLAGTYPVIIVSGSPRADVEEAVRLLEAESHVRFVLGAEDYAPGKPSPAGFLEGARRLGVPPQECLVFEDSQAGVAAARSAGMRCVALSRPCAHPQDLSEADWVLGDLGQFSVDAFERQLTLRSR